MGVVCRTRGARPRARHLRPRRAPPDCDGAAIRRRTPHSARACRTATLPLSSNAATAPTHTYTRARARVCVAKHCAHPRPHTDSHRQLPHTHPDLSPRHRRSRPTTPQPPPHQHLRTHHPPTHSTWIPTPTNATTPPPPSQHHHDSLPSTHTHNPHTTTPPPPPPPPHPQPRTPTHLHHSHHTTHTHTRTTPLSPPPSPSLTSSVRRAPKSMFRNTSEQRASNPIFGVRHRVCEN